jgi:hypothetical protein
LVLFEITNCDFKFGFEVETLKFTKQSLDTKIHLFFNPYDINKIPQNHQILYKVVRYAVGILHAAGRLRLN